MLRELIVALLCTITISMLSSSIFGGKIESDKMLVDTVVGVVGAGNFSYWHLGHVGPLLVELTSISGDADLYISDSLRPSYEVDQNNFSSTTCGQDIVNIPADFPRPLGIGVFGDWAYSMSKYSIQVFLDTTKVVKVVNLDISELSSGKINIGTGKIANRRTDEEPPRYLKLLNVLDMIFDTFFL